MPVNAATKAERVYRIGLLRESASVRRSKAERLTGNLQPSRARNGQLAILLGGVSNDLSAEPTCGRHGNNVGNQRVQGSATFRSTGKPAGPMAPDQREEASNAGPESIVSLCPNLRSDLLTNDHGRPSRPRAAYSIRAGHRFGHARCKALEVARRAGRPAPSGSRSAGRPAALSGVRTGRPQKGVALSDPAAAGHRVGDRPCERVSPVQAGRRIASESPLSLMTSLHSSSLKSKFFRSLM